jgi:hypothetical protein
MRKLHARLLALALTLLVVALAYALAFLTGP